MEEIPFELELQEIVKKENLSLIKGNKKKTAALKAENTGNPFAYQDFFEYGIVNVFNQYQDAVKILEDLEFVKDIVVSNLTNKHLKSELKIIKGKYWRREDNIFSSRIYFPSISLSIDNPTQKSYLHEVLENEFLGYTRMYNFSNEKTIAQITIFPSLNYAKKAIDVENNSILTTNNDLRTIIKYK